MPACLGVVHVKAVQLHLFLTAETVWLHGTVQVVVGDARRQVFLALQHFAGGIV